MEEVAAVLDEMRDRDSMEVKVKARADEVRKDLESKTERSFEESEN